MEDISGNLTNDDLEVLRDELTRLEMEQEVCDIDHRLEIKKIKDILKKHE